jgi:hypothetical protein
MTPDATTRGAPVIHSNWLEELRETRSVDEVVSFAASHLARIKESGNLPLLIANHAVDGPEDIRGIASALAHQPFVYNTPGYESVADQHLLILFSLASDRLAIFESGPVRRAAERALRAP